MQFAPVQFAVETPCRDEVPSNIEHALSLGLPEADGDDLKRLTIIANGPSALQAPLGGETLALNGALALFMNTQRAPTYWAACDPQRDLVLNFLDIPLSEETIYFVGSKCHPDVFKRLEGYDVRLWHISDYPTPKPVRRVSTASTVTIVAMGLMRRLGYRAFDIWGWDACYGPNGEQHANKTHDLDPANNMSVTVGAIQRRSPAQLTEKQLKQLKAIKTWGKRLGVDVPDPPGFTEVSGGREFQTTKSWALEAQDAMMILSVCDYDVTIHGDGMIKAIWESRY